MLGSGANLAPRNAVIEREISPRSRRRSQSSSFATSANGSFRSNDHTPLCICLT